jgi:hypothetical protein
LQLDSHDENHLLLELPVVVVFGADLPIEMQQFLESLVPRRQHVLNDGHDESGLTASTAHKYHDTSAMED